MKNNISKKSVLIFLYLWYCLSVILLAPLLIDYFFDDYNVITELFAELFSVVIPVLIVKTMKDKTKKNSLFRIKCVSLKSIGIKKVLSSIIMIIAFYFFIQYTINGIHILIYLKTDDFGNVQLLSHPNFLTFCITVLVYAFLPAIFEELNYRAFYYDALNSEKPLLLFLCSSLTFASAHMNLITILNAFFFGLLMMIIYRKYYSLTLVVVLHFVYNLLDVIFSTYISFPYSILNILSDYANDMQKKSAVLISFSIAILTILIVIVLFRYLILIKYDNEKSNKKELNVSNKKLFEYILIFILILFSSILIFLKTW